MRTRILSLTFLFLFAFPFGCALSGDAIVVEIPPTPSNAATTDGMFITVDPDEPAPAPTIAPMSDAEKPWLYPIPTEILADPMDVLRLVNKANLLDKNYPPQDIDMYQLVHTDARKVSTDDQVRKIANDALVAMFDAAAAEGITLYVKSAYRSYQTQDTMHYNRVKDMGRDDGMVQSAGASDHQTGLGVDVVSKAWSDRKLNADFAKTAEGKWLAENCTRFGFVIRYPEGKSDITGIGFEPWHMRYVGTEVARYMTAMGLTLEEFTAEWKGVLADYENSVIFSPAQEPEVDSFTF